jgi:hypothetical protein
MSASPSDQPASDEDQNEPDIEADRQADAMKDQLRKDVASWAAARSGDSQDLGVGRPAAPAARQAASPAVPRAPRQKAKVTEAAKPVEVKKQPFRMSYDGTTDKDYIAQRIKLGAR